MQTIMCMTTIETTIDITKLGIIFFFSTRMKNDTHLLKDEGLICKFYRSRQNALFQNQLAGFLRHLH